MKTLVLYSSLTGNTKKIAQAIYEAIPFEKYIYKVSDDININEYDLIAMGYWVDKGICDNKSKILLESIENKKIILFGTLGAKDSGEYYENTKKKVENIISDSNEIIGHFLCQGKINEKVIERYEEILKSNEEDNHIRQQLDNYKAARNHPNGNDIVNAKMFMQECVEKLI